MKTFLIGFALIVSAFALVNPIYGEWEKWKMEYNPKYPSNAEHNKRFRIFAQNRHKVLELNRLYGSDPNGPRFALNKFADLSSDEFLKVLNKGDSVDAVPFVRSSNKDYPKKLDWREKGAVGPVRDQGADPVWPYVSTDNMDSVYMIANGGKLPSLSVQQLLDCDQDPTVPGALDYAVRNGMTTDDVYPYTGVSGTCKYNPQTTTPIYRFSKSIKVSTKDDDIVAALNDIGPLIVTVDAEKWQFYSGGIFNLDCGTQLNHNALLVGYDSVTVSGKEVLFWIIKNSWGQMWGESGYIRLIRGQDECGVNDAVYTIVA